MFTTHNYGHDLYYLVTNWEVERHKSFPTGQSMTADGIRSQQSGMIAYHYPAVICFYILDVFNKIKHYELWLSSFINSYLIFCLSRIHLLFISNELLYYNL